MGERESQHGVEVRMLRALCDEAKTREARQRLLDSLGPNSFTEPEHQIVFESIRTLLPSGLLTKERLQVHLTRRGFPDTDVEPYFRVK